MRRARRLLAVVAALAVFLLGMRFGEARENRRLVRTVNEALAVSERANQMSNRALAEAETFKHISQIAMAYCRDKYPRPKGADPW